MTAVLQGYSHLELLSNQCEQMIHHALTIDISVESLLELQVCSAALLNAVELMHPVLQLTNTSASSVQHELMCMIAGL